MPEVTEDDNIKRKIESGVNLDGTYINLNDPCISKIVSKVGFDYIWIDMEHNYLSYDNLLCHIQTIQAYGISVIVRVPPNDLTATKKILDMGIQMISTGSDFSVLADGFTEIFDNMKKAR